MKTKTEQQWVLADETESHSDPPQPMFSNLPGLGRRGKPPPSADQAQVLVRSLTAREQQVLRYLVCGYSNKVIADEIGVSQRTIEAHRSRIFIKMQVRNAVQLVACLAAGGTLAS